MSPRKIRGKRPRKLGKAKPKVVNKITKEQRAAYRQKLRVIVWKTLKKGIAILRGHFSQGDKKFGVCGRNKQGPANAIVAAVYATFKKAPKWRSVDLDYILRDGNDLYRKTVTLNKLKIGSTFTANCVYPTFYVGYNKVTVFVENDTITGEICPKNADFEAAFTKTLSDLVKNTTGVIMLLGTTSFSIWGDGSNYFCFCPHDGDNKGKLITHLNFGTSFVLRTKELPILMNYIIENYSGRYILYSLKILNKAIIKKPSLSILCKKPVKDDKDEEMPLNKDVAVAEKPKEEPKTQKTQKAQKAAAAAGKKGGKPATAKKVDKQVISELKDPPVPAPGFSPDYKEISANKGILVAKSFVKEPEVILHTTIAASIIHSLFRSYMWTVDTLSDILKLGKTIFENSEDVAKSENWIERVKYPIEHNNTKFRLILENIIYGVVYVPRSNKVVLDFKQGVIDFFNKYDVGLVRGPQMVLLWQESGLFYMFDPKERDGMGRKWTKLLGADGNKGFACVTWYKNIADLAETYVSNINAKHKQDPYRIVKVLVYGELPKQEDFKEWLALDMEKWRIVGKTSICTKSSEKDTVRPTKAICIAVAASIMIQIKPLEEWTKDTIDEIIKAGMEVFKQTKLDDEDADPKSKGKEKTDSKKGTGGSSDGNFGIKDIKKYVLILENNVKLAFEELVNGKIIGTVTKEEEVGLAKGLETFFGQASNGVLSVRDRHLGIWYSDKFYYMFYPYEKIYGRTDISACKPDNPDLFGYAYALRFKDLRSLTKQILNFLNIEENMDFSITSVTVAVGAKDVTKPPLYNFKDLNPQGAILRPFKNDYHEGHEVFGSRKDKQTLANVLTAVGLAHINKPDKWNQEDLEDILRIGDRIYCKHISKLKECGFKKFTYEWKDVELIIGSNKYKVNKKADTTGPFKARPEEGEEEEEEEVPPEDLKKILTDWDSEATAYAVIDCPFFKVAVWKQSKLYFIFDSKASNEQGYPSERRIKKGTHVIETRYAAEEEEEEEMEGEKKVEGEKKSEGEKKVENKAGADSKDKKKEENKGDTKEEEEEEVEEPTFEDVANDGAAYVAWFTTLEALIEHLLSKVPPQFHYEEMTFTSVTLTNSMLSSDAAIQYRFIFHQMPEGGPLILRATSSQNDLQFPNRGLQEASNSIIALVFALISIPEKWNSTILDIILKYGDRLYTKSLSWLKETDPKTACFIDKLSVQHIIPTFTIYHIKFAQKSTSQNFGGLSIDFKELRKLIAKMGTIEANVGIFAKIKGYVTTLWKSGTTYFLFDPSPTDPNGYVAQTGFASLTKFVGLNPLVDYLSKKYGGLPGSNVFELTFLEITKSLPSGLPTSGVNIGKADESPYGRFVSHEKETKILTGPLDQHKIPVILLCLATLIHSHLHFVELWTDNVFYQILFLAEYLLGKTSCELDTITDIIKVDLEQVIPNLVIDNILVHVNVQNTYQGPLFPNPDLKNVPLKNALAFYFRDCFSAIITINDKQFAIWKENNSFYFFEDQNNKRKGNIYSAKNYECFYDYVTKDVKDSNDSLNWYKIQNVKITTIPLKDACQPTKLSTFEMPTVTGIFCLKNSPSVVNKYGEDCYYWDYATNKSKPTTLPKPKKNKEIKRVSSKMEVVVAKTPSEKHKLYDDKVKYYASIRAAIVVAAGMVCIKRMEHWTGRTIDSIIKSGIILYMNTVAARGRNCVQITNFETIFYMMKTRLSVEAQPPMSLCLMEGDSFKNMLKELSKEYKTLYLEATKEKLEEGSLILLLIFEECNFYIFCPCGANNKEGNSTCNPCLIRFETISDMVKQIFFIIQGQGFEHLVALGPIAAKIK